MKLKEKKFQINTKKKKRIFLLFIASFVIDSGNVFDIDKSPFIISVGLLNKPRSIIKFRHISHNVSAIVRADVLSQRNT